MPEAPTYFALEVLSAIFKVAGVIVGAAALVGSAISVDEYSARAIVLGLAVGEAAALSLFATGSLLILATECAAYLFEIANREGGSG